MSDFNYGVRVGIILGLLFASLLTVIIKMCVR